MHIHWEFSIQWLQQIRAVVLIWLTFSGIDFHGKMDSHSAHVWKSADKFGSHCCINFLARILRWYPCQVAYAVLPSIFEQTKANMTIGYSQEPIEECSVGRPLSVLKPASLTLDLSSKVGSYTDSYLRIRTLEEESRRPGLTDCFKYLIFIWFTFCLTASVLLCSSE